jgi:thiopeptide-type bacteriocin biosynthesis protein
MSAWTSFHIFVDSGVPTDAFVRESLPGIASRLSGARSGSWFFIRYWEGGPHVRLRVRLAEGVDPAESRDLLASAVAAYCGASSEIKEEYYRNQYFENREIDPNAMPWFERGSVEIIPYVAETVRYGGPAVIAATEQVFCDSTRIALSTLRASASDDARKVGAAITLMAVAAACVVRTPEALSAFFRRYQSFWAWASNDGIDSQGPTPPAASRRVADAIIQAALSNTSKGEIPAAWRSHLVWLTQRLMSAHTARTLIDPFTGALTRTLEEAQVASAAIVASHMHMLNNRTGVTPPQEYRLAALLANSENRA